MGVVPDRQTQLSELLQFKDSEVKKNWIKKIFNWKKILIREFFFI